jgi:single-stranded-DNA-specific exonuclease
VGIVCSRLVERFRRPAILMQRADGRCKGSGRSIDGFNLHAALAACAEHLHSFGGHDMAAGLTLDETELDAFTHAFTRHAADAITDEMTAPRLAIDCDASLAELTVDAHQRIERLGPFGRANPRPTLLLRGVRLARHAETMGRHAKHLRLQVDDPAAGTRRSMKIIGWSMGELAPSLRAGQRLDLAIRPTVNRWNGSVTAEAELADFDANAQQRDAHPSGATGIPTTAGV